MHRTLTKALVVSLLLTAPEGAAAAGRARGDLFGGLIALGSES